MRKEEEHLEALQDIRKMMKDSSRFLSLSGLSGVFAGLYALAGAWIGKEVIGRYNEGYPRGAVRSPQAYQELVGQIILICLSVLVACILTAVYFSGRKARKNNQRLFDHTSKRLLWNMVVPLLAGGIFCLALISHGQGFVLLVSPVMLIFYGLALISSSKFTLHDIRYLGYLEVTLGLLACFFTGHGLLFWTLGFGVLHVIYGTVMWYKYDRRL